jgi:hypothetical protein
MPMKYKQFYILQILIWPASHSVRLIDCGLRNVNVWFSKLYADMQCHCQNTELLKGKCSALAMYGKLNLVDHKFQSRKNKRQRTQLQFEDQVAYIEEIN